MRGVLMAKYTVLSVILALSLQCGARYFERCELVYELRRQGFPEEKMRDWVCLVDFESGRKTNVIGPMNKDGSRDYGLFQINDKWWCNKGSRPGKDCHVTCGDLLTDDITTACACAKKIYKRHNFYAWHAWRDYCQNTLPDISNCTTTILIKQ